MSESKAVVDLQVATWRWCAAERRRDAALKDLEAIRAEQSVQQYRDSAEQERCSAMRYEVAVGMLLSGASLEDATATLEDRGR